MNGHLRLVLSLKRVAVCFCFPHIHSGRGHYQHLLCLSYKLLMQYLHFSPILITDVGTLRNFCSKILQIVRVLN